MEEPKATVIIPTYNKVERLGLVLEAFNHQKANTNSFEVLIINDGSTDNTASCVKKFKQSCRYQLRSIRQSHKGRSSARNTGIEAAECPLLIFCDDDTIPANGFVAAHIAAHNDFPRPKVVHGLIYDLPFLKFFKDPVNGILYKNTGHRQPLGEPSALKRLLLSPTDFPTMKKIEEQKRLSYFEKLLQTIFMEPFPSLQWLAFSGGNVSLLASLIKKAGLFDPIFDHLWGSEDQELGYRLHGMQIPFDYNREACNYHITHYRFGFPEDLKKSHEIFYRKHPKPEIYHLTKLLTTEVRTCKAYMELLNNHSKKMNNNTV